MPVASRDRRDFKHVAARLLFTYPDALEGLEQLGEPFALCLRQWFFRFHIADNAG